MTKRQVKLGLPAIGVVAAVGFFAGACNVFAPIVDRTSEATAEAVVAYCDNFTPEQRAAFRSEVDSDLPDGYTITVICPGMVP